jgi:hypothetical protein
VLDYEASSFRVDTPIRLTLDFAPPVPKFSDVGISVFQDGRERIDLGSGIFSDVETTCFSGPISALGPGALGPITTGHYRVEVDTEPEWGPPASAEFDVTP